VKGQKIWTGDRRGENFLLGSWGEKWGIVGLKAHRSRAWVKAKIKREQKRKEWRPMKMETRKTQINL